MKLASCMESKRSPQTWSRRCGPPIPGLSTDRDDLRYPSDLTDEEWQILAPLFPPPARTGRHRAWQMREMINAIFFVLRGGRPVAHVAGALPAAPDDVPLVHALS